MSDLSGKFSALQAQLDIQAETMQGYVDTVETKLQSIADFLDVMNINNAANARAILAAIGQTGACFPCPTPPITVPPIDTTINPVNEDRCKRSQAFIATIHEILAAMDTLQSFNVVGTFNVINDAISDIIASVAAGDTVPLPSFPETVQIVGTYVSYAGERLFSGVGLIEQFSPLEATLTQALANTDSTDAAKGTYDSIISSSGVSAAGKFLFQAVPYQALYNYFFDPATEPDLSGYSGAACTLAGCTTITAIPTALSPRAGTVSNTYAAPPPLGFGADNDITFSVFDPYVFAEPIIWVGDIYGYTFDYGSGQPFHIDAIDGSNNNVFHTVFSGPGLPVTCTVHTVKVLIANNTNAGSAAAVFTVDVCPPEE